MEQKLDKSIKAKFMHKNFPGKMDRENRSEPRSTELKNYRVEIKFVGEPIYQFRVTDVSNRGAGLLIKDDSDFLSMIKIGQFVDINLISPKGSNPSGMYKAEIKHITKPEKGKHKGHCLAGIAIKKNTSQHSP